MFIAFSLELRHRTVCTDGSLTEYIFQGLAEVGSELKILLCLVSFDGGLDLCVNVRAVDDESLANMVYK